MIRNSLTAKIIISVSIVITIAIGIFAYIIVRVQTNELMDRAKSNGIFISHLIYQHISQVMLTGNHGEIREFFLNIGRSEEVQRIFLFDNNGRIVFSSEAEEIGGMADDFYRQLLMSNDNPVNFKVYEDQKIFSIVTPVKNKQECQYCHGTKPRTLGVLGLDISLIPAEREIANNRNWIILFAFVILALVSAVISVLVVVLVRRPVGSLIRTMTAVEQGDLKVRVNIKNKNELGRLGTSFNSMIISLEQVKSELQKHHEQQMQQAEKLATIGELASGIAHEIKNPLAGISAAIQVLAEECNLRTTHREVIDEIMQQLERLNKNTRDLLSFARPAEPKFLVSDLNEVINRAVFYVKKQAERQNVCLIEELEQGIPNILIDPEQIQQVFLNIMLNAIQAMSTDGCLNITTQRVTDIKFGTPETVKISFTDTGKGIPGDHLRRIFNPFFTTKHRGTGLGLSISRNIVEKHGGRIEMESEPGKGTCITIILTLESEKNG